MARLKTVVSTTTNNQGWSPKPENLKYLHGSYYRHFNGKPEVID